MPSLPKPRERLSSLLLELWISADEACEQGFQARALELLRARLPFDSALWGYARSTPDGLEPHAVCLLGIPEAAIADYLALGPMDRVAEGALRRPGQCVRSDGDDPAARLSEAFQAFDLRYGLHHTCTVALAHPFSGLTMFVSLYRRQGREAFGEPEGRLLEDVGPHLSAAFDRHRRVRLLREAGWSGRGGGAALVDRQGLLHLADDTFLELLRRGWPRWLGPGLPAELARATTVERHGVVMSRRKSPDGALDLLLARPRRAADLLTPRQLEVARAYAGGADHRQIARALGITPTTVRNHLHLVYAELQVHNKAQLIAALDGAPSPEERVRSVRN